MIDIFFGTIKVGHVVEGSRPHFAIDHCFHLNALIRRLFERRSSYAGKR